MRILRISAISIVFIAGFFILTSSLQKGVKRTDIKFSTVDIGTIQTSVNASGKVVAAFEEIITSPINSRIVGVDSKAGDNVDAGTPLLRLDLQTTETELNKLQDQIEIKQYELEQLRIDNDTHIKDLAMQVEVKEMSVNRLRVELRNERYLDSLGSGTGDRVKEAELAYNTGRLELEQMRQRLANERLTTEANLKVKQLDINIARKNIDQIRRTLADAQIRSPRKATLTYINDRIGQKVSEGERLAVIADLSHFKIDGDISESYSQRIAPGAKAVVRIGNKTADGIVTNVTPQSLNGVISFSVSLDNDSLPILRSGVRTDIYIMCDVVADAMRIHNGPYYSGAGDYELFVADGDDKIVKRQVRLGDSNYEYVEVVSGLKPGDRVVITNMNEFKNSKTLTLK